MLLLKVLDQVLFDSNLEDYPRKEKVKHVKMIVIPNASAVRCAGIFSLDAQPRTVQSFLTSQASFGMTMQSFFRNDNTKLRSK